MSLFKQSLIYLALTSLVVFFPVQIQSGLIYVKLLFVYCNHQLAYYFPNYWLVKIITLIVLSVGIMSIPGGLFWLIKRKKMPYFLELTWVLWVIFVTSNLIIH